MDDNEPGPVRHPFKLEEPTEKEKRKMERMVAGGQSAGLVINITSVGIELNGYYTALERTGTKYSNLMSPVLISWEDLEKSKAILNKTTKKVRLDRIEREVDEAYLKELPKVTIGSELYYIDSIRRERRLVRNPHRVDKF